MMTGHGGGLWRLLKCGTVVAALAATGCTSKPGAPGSRPADVHSRYRGEPAALAICLGHRLVEQKECTGTDYKAMVGTNQERTEMIFACIRLADPGLAMMAIGSAVGGSAGMGAFAAGAMSRGDRTEGTVIYSARFRAAAAGAADAEFWASHAGFETGRQLALMKTAMVACDGATLDRATASPPGPAGR